MADNGWRTEPLPWDSEFWSCRVARVSTDAGARPTLDGLVNELAQIDFAYLLCPPERVVHLGVAEAAGFRTLDLRCDVAVDLAEHRPIDTRHEIRPATSGEIVDTAELAAALHRNTRFANDPHLDRRRVEDLYRRWVLRDAQRQGWQVQVAVVGGRLAGYVSHGPINDAEASIGLIGVDVQARGQGLGRALLLAAVGAEQRTGHTLLSTVTQGGNQTSMRLYQSAGFRVERVQIWLHWHRP